MLGIRPATLKDVPLLREMIVEFATFERLADELTITEETLARDGFGARPRFRVLISEWQDKPAGYAMYFPFYSSFQGPGLFLEDVYVRPEFRGKGIGKALNGGGCGGRSARGTRGDAFGSARLEYAGD